MGESLPLDPIYSLLLPFLFHHLSCPSSGLIADLDNNNNNNSIELNWLTNKFDNPFVKVYLRDDP